MSLYTGVTGRISIEANDLAHMANWSVDLTKDMIEVVSFGNDYKEKIPSIKDWSAACDGKVDYATGSGQKDLVAAFEAGTLLACIFYLDESTFMTGSAYVESLSFSTAADGAADISISLAGSGAMLQTIPTT